MQETQPSKDSLEILFGKSDDTLVPVSDIKIHFVEGARVILWKCREQWEGKFSRVRVFHDCNGLHIVGEGETDGERFIPSTSIANVAVDHLPGHKFDRP